MKKKSGYDEQKDFWEYAGNVGYGKAIFSSPSVEKHIISRQWRAVLSAAKSLGLGPDSNILELGCGDGDFANNVLAPRFKHIDAYDGSGSAIDKANSNATTSNVTFSVKDITGLNYQDGARWDGAFLVGFLHHVKQGTPEIIKRLSKVCPKVVVLEPNGDNIIRKLLEQTPSYKKAGEDSFKLKRLRCIFEDNGYKAVTVERITLVPAQLPERLFSFVKKVERIVEPTPMLNRLCATYVIGFTRS